MKLRALSLLLSFFIFIGFANAKPLPPGTGNSIPANILFLIDKSQSMWSSSTGDGRKKAIRPFNDVTPALNGNYFTVSVDNSGFGYWRPYANEIRNDNSVFGGIDISRAHGYKDRNLDNPINMEYRNKFLYILQDKTTSNQVKGYTLMSINTTKKGLGKKPDKDATSWFTTVNAAKDQTGLKTTGKKGPKDSKGNKPWVFISKPSMDLYDNKIWAISKDAWRVITLNNNTNNGHLRDSTSKVCNSSPGIRKSFDDAIDIVKEGSKLFIYSKDGANGFFFKNEINETTGCPVGSLFIQWTHNANFDKECGYGKGQSIAVRNKIIFTTGYATGKVCKYTQTTNGVMNLAASVGIKDAFTPNASANPEVYIDKPMGIAIGAGDATETQRIYVASHGRNEVIIFNQSNLDYVDHFGDAGISLWKGAEESISFVLQDSAITQQANFGIGYWQGGKAGFSGFKYDDNNPNFDMPRKGESNFPEGNISVGINPNGAQQILKLFSEDRITLKYGTLGSGLQTLMNQYWTYQGGKVNPMIKGLDCQVNAMIIIGDGKFTKYADRPVKAAAARYQLDDILTFAVGYGDTFANDNTAVGYFKEIAKAGGTHKETGGVVSQQGYFIARTPADLKNVIDQIVQTIIGQTFSYSSPSISSEIAKTGQLFQGKFQNRKNKEWWGTIIRTDLTDAGDALTTKQVWDANDKIKDPAQRNIWTALEGTSGKNNFVEANRNIISNLYSTLDLKLTEYHRKTVGPNGLKNLTRCKNEAVLDGTNNDEDKGLINFIRGEDYFDYDGDCNLKEPKMRFDEKGKQIKALIADIYNSELLIVGKPSASIVNEKLNTESYFRQKNNYKTFANNNVNRKEVIYGAANNGLLHAFDAETGEELWGFIPPVIIPKLPRIINSSLNQSGGGGTVPLFLLDGSATVHDTYFEHPNKGEGWYTLLMIPYGRAGAGFSLIDITDPNDPNHIYSILNDPTSQKIIRVDHLGKFFEYPYKTTRISTKDFLETITAENNLLSNQNNCDSSGSTSCYKGKIWTSQSLFDLNEPYTIYANGKDITSTTTVTEVSGQIRYQFQDTYTYDATGSNLTDSLSVVQVGSISTAGAEYDYRYLGETWGSPRVFRMPNLGAGDNNVLDDEYVAVIGGGFGNHAPSIGSTVFVIDWLTGKVKKEIKIADKAYDANSKNDVVNSIPGTPIVINADAANANYSGALVYINDLEGKVTKINLTNMKETPEYDNLTNSFSTTTSKVELYDKYTLFDTMVSTEINNRYMYHPMDAGIGIKTKNLWLFGGTGNFMNLNDIQTDYNKVKNVMFGIKDQTFPFFGTKSTTSPDNFLKCKNTSDDQDGSKCPDISDKGWYIELDDQKKVVNEPTFTGNVAYYPIFKPLRGTKSCGSGKAYICAVDAECGTNFSKKLGTNEGSESTEECYYVGTGVLSKIIGFGTKLYANISGESINTDKNDIVIIDSIDSGLVNYRSSWRENF